MLYVSDHSLETRNSFSEPLRCKIDALFVNVLCLLRNYNQIDKENISSISPVFIYDQFLNIEVDGKSNYTIKLEDTYVTS